MTEKKMNFLLINLRENYKISFAALLSLFGIFFNLIGLCVGQSGRNPGNSGGFPTNPLGLAWYLLFFYLSWTSIVVTTIAYDAIKTYRFLLLALTAIAISYIPLDIHSALMEPLGFFNNSSISVGSGLRTFGLIFIFFPVMSILIMLGSEEQSLLSDMFYLPNKSVSNEKASQLESEIPNNLAKNQYHQSVFVNLNDAESVAAKEARSSLKPTTRIQMNRESVVAFKARTLYAYEANPADPTEISFKKGDILNVIDSKGKWWHVQKVAPDGTIISGIAPSNYLQTV